MTVETRCQFPEEHIGALASPEDVAKINRGRRTTAKELGEKLPRLEFYAFVQHESEVFCAKRHTVHAVVNIGQSFSLSHNFLEPQHVKALHRQDGAGKHRCTCAEGTTTGGKVDELDLRLFRCGEDAAQGQALEGDRDGTSV